MENYLAFEDSCWLFFHFLKKKSLMICICINQAIGIGASKFTKYVESLVKIFVVGGQNSRSLGTRVYKMTTIWPHLVDFRCHFSHLICV